MPEPLIFLALAAVAGLGRPQTAAGSPRGRMRGLLFMVVVGCGGDPAADSAEVAPAELPALELRPERTYSTPDVALSDAERTDILDFCAAVEQCNRARCTDTQIPAMASSVKPRSAWGKMIQKAIKGYTLDETTQYLARLVRQEGLDWEPACRPLLKRGLVGI